VPTRMRQLGYAVQNLYGAVYSNLQGQPLHGGGAAVAGESAVQLSARFVEGCSALCAYHEWWFWGKVQFAVCQSVFAHTPLGLHPPLRETFCSKMMALRCTCVF
jgi:hypothetical protein